MDVSQIESVDVYSGTLPNDMRKKRVTIPDDIESIVDSFSQMRVWRKALDGDVQEGEEGINMCFKMRDGSEKLILVNGQVVTCDLGNYYVSGSMFDVVFYNSLRYPEEQVESLEFPSVQVKKDPEKFNLEKKFQDLQVYCNAFRKYIRALYLNLKM